MTNELRNIDLSVVMQLLGFSGHREGKSIKFKSDGKVIVITGNKFFDFIENKGSGGAIDLVMHIKKCTFPEAVSFLKEIGSNTTFMPISKFKPAEKQTTLSLHIRDDTKIRAVIDYLTLVRKINREVVEELIASGDIYANEHGSCVFVLRDSEGKVIGTSCRATRGFFKQVLGSKTGLFTIGKISHATQYAVLVESPIDALSFITLFGRDETRTVYAAAGNHINFEVLSSLVKRNLTIVCCFDNDEGGEAGSRRVQEDVEKLKGAFMRYVPRSGKDWNDHLLLFQAEKQRRQKKSLAGAI